MAKLPNTLNPTAKRIASRLVAAFPAFADDLEVVEGGHFEAAIGAPEDSPAGALVCRTTGEGDIWVRYAPPEACYPVQDADELVAVVEALLQGDALMAVIVQGDEWVGTTLIAPGAAPPLEPGQHARVLTWTPEEKPKSGSKPRATAKRSPAKTDGAARSTPKRRSNTSGTKKATKGAKASAARPRRKPN